MPQRRALFEADPIRRTTLHTPSTEPDLEAGPAFRARFDHHLSCARNRLVSARLRQSSSDCVGLALAK